MSDNQTVPKKDRKKEEKERKKREKEEKEEKAKTLKKEKENLKIVKDKLKTTWTTHAAELKKKELSTYEEIEPVKKAIINILDRLTGCLSQITNDLIIKENGDEESTIETRKEDSADRRTGYMNKDRNAAQEATQHGIQARGEVTPGKSQNQMEWGYHELQRKPGHSSRGGMHDSREMKNVPSHEKFDQRNRIQGQTERAENRKYVEVHGYGSQDHSVTKENRHNETEPAPDYLDQDTESSSRNLSEEYAKTMSTLKELDMKNKELREKLSEEKSHVSRLEEELKKKEEIKLEGTKRDAVNIGIQTSTDESEREMQYQGNHSNKFKDNTQNKTNQEEHADMRGEYQQKMNELENELKKLRSLEKQKECRLRDIEAELQNEVQGKNSLEAQMKKVTFEKNEALTRLSEIAGRRLLDNNPSIADLSTEIRPTKIGENFKQLYDNEWTEAFEELTEQEKAEDECIKILLQIVQDTFKCAMEEAENFESKLVTIVTSFPEISSSSHKNTTKDEEELIKQLKRVSAARTSTAVQDMYVRKIELKGNIGERLKSYARKCMELCWYMAVQSPPMVIIYGVQHKGPFDEKYYARYTATGDLFDYVVWPCTLLHEKGPVLAKGVAQATKGDKGDLKRKAAPAAPKEKSNEQWSSTKPSSVGQEGIRNEDNPKTRYQKRDEKNKSEQRGHDIYSKTQGGRFGQNDNTKKETSTSTSRSKSLYMKPGTNEESAAGGLVRSQSVKTETAPANTNGKNVTIINL